MKKLPWQMRQAEFVASTITVGIGCPPEFIADAVQGMKDCHHDNVDDALKDGKDVPDSVLREYPDLIEKHYGEKLLKMYPEHATESL